MTITTGGDIGTLEAEGHQLESALREVGQKGPCVGDGSPPIKS